MVCAPVRSIIPSLKLGDYLSVQAHKPCSISHLEKLSVSQRMSKMVLSKFRSGQSRSIGGWITYSFTAPIERIGKNRIPASLELGSLA